MLTRFIGLLLIAFISGCASVHYELPLSGQQESKNDSRLTGHWERIYSLQDALLSLSEQVKPKEAASLAETAVFYSLQLANEYELMRPPLIHNTLVNMGIKDRGLCIHWTEDLLAKLRSLKLESFSFHWLVANKTAVFSLEHSSVVVLAGDLNYPQGLILDPWRNSGLLYFTRASDDEYNWKLWR